MYPKLYNSSGQLLAVLDNIIKETASIKRVVNGEFTFAFEAYEKELKSEYFDPANALVVDGQTFDIKYIEQEHETDVRYDIQCEHVNYRMEDGEENLFPSYTYTGTPTQILSNILAGTEFSVGTVEFTDAITITVNTEITRKSLIYELANTLGGEVDYTNLGFTINILASIGKNNGFQARFGKNLKGIRKIIDNRGGLKTYYSVDIIMLKNSNEYIEKELRDLEIVDVGDTIQLIDPVIGLDLQNRILSREYNPIFEVNTKLEIANNIELISTKMKQIETSTVHKNKFYNGARISAEDGFVAERSDGKAKTVMNATEGISIYSDAGSGLTRNFYVDMDGYIRAKKLVIEGDSVFKGELLSEGQYGTVHINEGYVTINDSSSGHGTMRIHGGSLSLYDGSELTLSLFNDGSIIAKDISIRDNISAQGRADIPTVDCDDLLCYRINGETPIHSGNIANQAVSYADSAGSVGYANYASESGSSYSAGSLYRGGGGGSVYVSANNNFRPVNDAEDNDWSSCGTAEGRWSSVWALNGAILTSDERQKTHITQLHTDPRFLRFAKMVVPYTFKMVNGTSGRNHVGFIAQRVEEAMNTCGISDMEFAGIIKAPVYSEMLKDKDGNEINEYDTTSEIIDYSYHLRYDEFIPLIFLWLRDIESRLSKEDVNG